MKDLINAHTILICAFMLVMRCVYSSICLQAFNIPTLTSEQMLQTELRRTFRNSSTYAMVMAT